MRKITLCVPRGFYETFKIDFLNIFVGNMNLTVAATQGVLILI